MTTVGETIEIIRGDSFSYSVELGDLTGYEIVDFTVKICRETDLDSEAIIQVRKTAGGEDDGLLVLNGGEGTAEDGSLTITDESTGAITLTLDKEATVLLVPSSFLFYDYHKIVGGIRTTVRCGACRVTADVGRAIE